MKKIFFSLLCCLFVDVANASDLKAAIEAAEKRDPTLGAALAGRDASAENVALTRAKLLPLVSATGSYQKTNQNRTQDSLLGPISQDYRVNATNSQIYIKQALIRPRDWFGLSIGYLQANYGVYELAGAYSNLWQKVANAWFDVLAANAVRDSYEKSLDGAQRAYKQADAAFKAGSGTKDAALEAKSQLEWFQANLTEAELSFKSKLRVLQLLTGDSKMTLSAKTLPNLERIAFPEKNYENLYGKAFETSPEILMARAAEEIRRLQISQAKSDHAPTVDLIGSYAKTQNDNVNLIGSTVKSAMVGVQVNIPLFSGGGINAGVRQAQAYYLAAQAETQATALKLQTQIDADWAAQAGYVNKLRAAKEMVLAAEDTLKASKMGLKAGVKSWADVAVAQNNVVRRQVDYINLMLTGLKTQLRLLGNLPIADDSWVAWVNQVDSLSKH